MVKLLIFFLFFCYCLWSGAKAGETGSIAVIVALVLFNSILGYLLDGVVNAL